MSGWLLDTHVLLWSLSAPAKLGARATSILESPDSQIHVSPISLWEIEIKRAKGKLHAPDDLAKLIHDLGFLPLDITYQHAQAAGRLLPHHADPFDRMLLAQAATTGLTLITADSQMPAYGIPILAATT